MVTTTPTEWLGNTQANIGNNIGGQNDVFIAAMPDGGWLISWTDTNNNVDAANGLDIIAQRYDALGNAIGSPFPLSDSWFGDNERDAVTAFLPDGSLIAAFIDDNGDDIIRITKSTTLGDDFSIKNVTNGSNALSNLDIAVFDDGGYVVVYQLFDGSENDIYAIYVDSAGAIGVPFQVSSSIADNTTNPRVTTLTNGNFVVTYDDQSDDNIEFQVFQTDGTVVTQGLLPGGVGADYDPAIAGLADNGFVVVWTEDEDILFTIRSNSGSASVATTTVVATGDIEDDPAVVALQDEGFVIFWDNDTDNLLYGQRYDSAGNTVGNQFTIPDVNSPNTINAVLLADGRIAISYLDTIIGNEPSFAIYDPRDPTIDGDSGDNVLRLGWMILWFEDLRATIHFMVGLAMTSCAGRPERTSCLAVTAMTSSRAGLMMTSFAQVPVRMSCLAGQAMMR